MATLPSATTSLNDTASALSTGEGFAVVVAAVHLNPDATVRVYAGSKGINDQHAYSQGLSYAASHFDETGKPVIFIGIPAVTAGVCGGRDSSGMVGTARPFITAAASGYLEATEAKLTVTKGGTVGTDPIEFSLSLDGDQTTQSFKLGTASSYTVPYVGIIVNFGAGTLVAGDKFLFRTSAPRFDAAGLAAARTALAGQQKLSRTWMIIGDCTPALAANVVTEVNGYETASKRFTLARANIVDRSPLARMSKDAHRMTGNPQITFAEVGSTGDTITRATGSFVTDGFAINDWIVVSGSASNNISGRVTNVTATVLTLDTADLAAEGPVSNITIVGSPTITFAEVGATGDTITRSGGSWIEDGFAVGDWVAVSGSGLNNFSATVASRVTAVSATVLTLDTQDLAAEEIGSHLISITKGQTMSAWMSAADVAFASIAAQKRIDISAGMLTKACPITKWKFRRPVSWHASLREYRREEHIPCWRGEDPPLEGAGMLDATGQKVEFDERTDGGGLAAKFTVATTYSNGPVGPFVAMSLTRENDASLLSRTHNMQVVNVACTVIQAETERLVGHVLVLKSTGKAEEDSLADLELKVNAALKRALLNGNNKDGPKASSAVWRASRDDILNVPNATLNGTADIMLNGTIEHVATSVRVLTNGGAQ